MSRLVNQYILEEGSALNDSSDGIPLRRQLSARGTGTLQFILHVTCSSSQRVASLPD